MALLIPSETRLSEHFLLSDMVGNHSVYTKGLRNRFEKCETGEDIRLTNAQFLAHECLEPLTHLIGSMSISYGFISPSVSQAIVTYQDWRKPSHHRWDLGAAVDICPHRYLQSTSKSPIEFALEQITKCPMSRVITYSESPYICVAVSAEEVANNAPREMYYENEYTGKKGEKPNFRRLGSFTLRERRRQELLKQDGLEWEGQGYPSYHGGGRRQYHHMRCSEYTMVSDFLYDEQSVLDGHKNVPALADERVSEAFKIAGRVYDTLLQLGEVLRLSIVSAYTSHQSSGYIQGRCWRGDQIVFEVVPPAFCGAEEFIEVVNAKQPEGFSLTSDGDRVIVAIEREAFSDDQQRTEKVRNKTRARSKRG